MHAITGVRTHSTRRGPAARASGRAPLRIIGRAGFVLAIGWSLAACDPPAASGDAAADNDAVAENAAPEQTRPAGAPLEEIRSAANHPAGQEPVVLVSRTPPLHLVDASGNALYALEGNRDGSKCDATCESAWPPVMAFSSRPSAAPGMQPGMLGALPREGGALQMTYDGKPLYRYAGDMGAAETAGHGVDDKWGHWRLVGADGALITQPVEDAPDGGASQAPSGTDEAGSAQDEGADEANGGTP